MKHPGTDNHRLLLNVGRRLNAHDVRRAGQNQFDGIEYPGDIQHLLIVPARGNRFRHRIPKSTDADEHLILSARSAARASNRPGVKLPGWSPSSVPFRITRAPNIALETLKMATAGSGPST